MTTTLGFDRKGAARNRASLFAAAGIGWPDGYEPESVHARQTDYPFSIDVSNNRILAALDRCGTIRRAVCAVGVDDVRGNAIPGVYIHKQLAFGEGRLGVEVTLDGRLCTEPAVDFADRVLPVFTDAVDGLRVTRTVFAPSGDGGRALRIVQLIEVVNDSDVPHRVTVRIGAAWRATERWKSLPAAITLTDRQGAVAGGEADLAVAAGETVVLAAVADFEPGTTPATPMATVADVGASLADTAAARRGALGVVEVPQAPWFGETLTRAAELARQAVLLLDDGTAAGSFWGSNANPLPDVWTRDLGYSALGLLDADPDIAARVIDFLAAYGLPDVAWEREAQLHPEATGLEHSLGNACLAAVLGDLYVQRHGRATLTGSAPRLPEYLSRLAGALLRQHPGAGGLYRTLYISDGPSRGDYHTGSNILAQRAAHALATVFADALTPGQVGELSALATDLKDTIERRCVFTVDGDRMYVEGIYDDGRYVAVHDGEESDLTLASVYGYTGRDDDRVRAHARWAHSPANPYFAQVTGGVDFWDWDDYNGVTYPGHIHALSATGSRADLAAALTAIRATTDLDGSFWWWPFAHGEPDPARVKRGLGKCGWCAGEFVAFACHDLLGVHRDHEAGSLGFVPYLPWDEFTWTGLGFAGGTVDLAASAGTVSVTNHTPRSLAVTLGVPLKPGRMIEDIRLDGENFRYQSDVVSLHDSVVVRGTVVVAPGDTSTLSVTTSANGRPC